MPVIVVVGMLVCSPSQKKLIGCFANKIVVTWRIAKKCVYSHEQRRLLSKNWKLELSNQPFFYLPYLTLIHEKANCIAMFLTGRTHSLGSCHLGHLSGPSGPPFHIKVEASH